MLPLRQAIYDVGIGIRLKLFQKGSKPLCNGSRASCRNYSLKREKGVLLGRIFKDISVYVYPDI